jgi:TPR repeat protein
MSCWEILGIAATNDKREIKRAYARLIKLNNPEDKPKEFQEIREACDQALMIADYGGFDDFVEDADQESDSPDALSQRESLVSTQEDDEASKVALEPTPDLPEKDQILNRQIEAIDAALNKLVPLLQRDEVLAIVHCRTTLNDEFFQALDARYEFEGRLLVTLLESNLFPFAFLKYLADEFQWDININRPEQMVTSHFDDDSRFNGAFYAVAHRYIEALIRRALLVNVQSSHSWLAPERFDQLDALLFTEGREQELPEYCKDKQNRELIEAAFAFLIKGQYVTEYSSFVPHKTQQWLLDQQIIRPIPVERSVVNQAQYTEEKPFRFPFWLACVIGFAVVRVFLSVVNDSHSDRSTSYKPAPAYDSSTGYTSPRDMAGRAIQLERGAESGSKEAQYYLSLEYLYGGIVFQRDVEKGLMWLRRSADQDYAPAKEKLGIFYYRGVFVEQDYQLAIPLLVAAANQNRADAMFWLAISYEQGNGVKQDADRAREYFASAIELGSTEALRTKGLRMLYAQGKEKDVVKGAQYLQIAIDKGDQDAAYLLAREYLSGKLLPVNYERAFKLLEPLASKDIPLAQFWVSELYDKGLGVPKNTARAKQLLDSAKLRQSPYATNEFAWQLATQFNKELRNGGLAVMLMEDLLIDPKNNTVERIDTLAAAYAEVGDFDKAIPTQQRAIDLLPPSVTSNQRRRFEDRLEFYRKGQALTE